MGHRAQRVHHCRASRLSFYDIYTGFLRRWSTSGLDSFYAVRAHWIKADAVLACQELFVALLLQQQQPFREALNNPHGLKNKEELLQPLGLSNSRQSPSKDEAQSPSSFAPRKGW